MEQQEKLARAAHAENAKAYMDDILFKKQELVLSRLRAMYREGKMDFPVICGLLGELTLIDDATSRAERDIKQGRQIEGKLYGTAN